MPDATIIKRICELAETAVEKLKLASVIEIHEMEFLETLVASHVHARETMGDTDVAFFADVIPWIASLMQVQSFVRQNDFVEAVEWTKKQFNQTDRPISVLTVLVTTHLIQRGCEMSRAGSAESQRVWQEIRERLDDLLKAETGSLVGSETTRSGPVARGQ